MDNSATVLLDWVKRGLKKPGKTRVGLGKAIGLANGGPLINRLLKGGRKIAAHELPAISKYIEEPVPLEIVGPSGKKVVSFAQRKLRQEVEDELLGDPIAYCNGNVRDLAQSVADLRRIGKELGVNVDKIISNHKNKKNKQMLLSLLEANQPSKTGTR